MHRYLFALFVPLLIAGCMHMDGRSEDPDSLELRAASRIDDPLVLDNDLRISDQREVSYRYYHRYDEGATRTTRYVVLLDKYFQDQSTGEFVLRPDDTTPDLEYFLRDVRLVIISSSERRNAFLVYDLESVPPGPQFREATFTTGEHSRAYPVTVTARQWARENRVRETGRVEIDLALLIRAAVTDDALTFRLITHNERPDVTMSVRGFEEEALLYALRSMVLYDNELRPDPAEIDDILVRSLAEGFPDEQDEEPGEDAEPSDDAEPAVQDELSAD